LRSQHRQIAFACEELPDNADDVLKMTQMQPGPDEILEKKEFIRYNPMQIGLTLVFQNGWRMPDNTSKMETFNES
jgi:hypothetical protein